MRPPSLFEDPGHVMNFYDTFTQRTVTEGFLANYVRRSAPILGVDFWSYNTAFAAPRIAASPIENVIQTQADSDFIISAIGGMVYEAADPNLYIFDPLLSLQITDQSTGKTFFNTPLRFRNVAGTGGNPFFLASPRVVRANANLTVELTVASDLYDNVWVALNGTRVYYGDKTS